MKNKHTSNIRRNPHEGATQLGRIESMHLSHGRKVVGREIASRMSVGSVIEHSRRRVRRNVALGALTVVAALGGAEAIATSNNNSRYSKNIMHIYKTGEPLGVSGVNSPSEGPAEPGEAGIIAPHVGHAIHSPVNEEHPTHSPAPDQGMATGPGEVPLGHAIHSPVNEEHPTHSPAPDQGMATGPGEVPPATNSGQ